MAMVTALTLLGIALFLTPLLGRFFGRNTGWPLAVVYLVVVGILFPLWKDVFAGHHPRFSVPWVAELDVRFALQLDGLGVVFSALALTIGAVVLLYSTRYLDKGPQHSFYLLMVMFTLAMLGLVMAGDLLILFICWELTSLASFMLIARSGREAEAPSMRTLLLTFVGGLFLLGAIVLIWARLGTTDIATIMAADLWQKDPAFTSLIAALIALAAMTKSAQFPFHIWLPDAMAAITPVSAYLHAAAVVKAGIFLLLRFSPIFHTVLVWQILLLAAGLITTVIGGLMALRQKDLKRLMAQSTVSQLGLIVLAIGVGTPAAVTAAVVHTIAHALFKSGLFMMVGVIDHGVHTRDIHRMPVHLYRKMPASFMVTILGAASMAGIPPLLGFVSKEAILYSLHGKGGAEGWFLLIAVGLSAVLTVSYCLKIVLGTFIDGTDATREVHHRDPWLLLWAAVPIVGSLPLVLFLSALDLPVEKAASAAYGEHTTAHLSLWHGINPAFIVTVAVLAIGVVVGLQRHRVFPFFEQHTPLLNGVKILEAWAKLMISGGQVADRLAATDRPTRHVASVLVALVAFGALGIAAVAPSLPAQHAGLSQPIDAIILILMIATTVAAVRAHSRLGATVALSGVGVLATLQILTLGAPDVAMTQLLVESLNIIVIMLVLQKLPLNFAVPRKPRVPLALGLSVAVGLVVSGLVWALTGRRERSDLANFFLTNTYDIAGGNNVVNVILVEFRAFDTLGELSVLGMAGVAILAILSTIRADRLDPVGIEERIAPKPNLALNPDPASTPWRAMYVAWPNSVAFQLTLKWINPVLVIVSVLLFLRGHNEPGGGFNAALIAAAIVGMIYMATSYDRQVGPPRAPLFLISGGILTAIATGFLGFFVKGSFLEPIHGYIAGIHLTSSMLFDLGVYSAVLGLILITFNLLGTSAIADERSEGARERVDEAVEGELPGPLNTVRGERISLSTSHIAQNLRPQESRR